MPSGFRSKNSARASCVAATLAAFALLLWGQTPSSQAQAVEEPPHPAALDQAIVAAAKRHGVPESLVRRVIMRESKYNPRARNRKFWGLMQISYPTAKSMGFKGTPQELLNPVVNLRYAVPYLANAFVIAGKQQEAAVRLYAAGYYNTARSRGLLSVLRTADSTPLSGVVEDQPILSANAVAQPPQSVGIFGALFGPGSQLQPQPQTEPPPQQQQVAATTAAAPDSNRPPAPGSAAPPGTFDGPTAAMITDKNGRTAPPKKWARDGGVSVMVRGEQAIEQVASRGKVAEGAPSKSRHARKLTAYAALDLPASRAQAYASSSAQDPRFATSASQAAIVQATSGPTAPTEQLVAVSQQAQSSASPQPVATDQSADDDRPAKRHRSRHAKRKPHGSQTQEARAEKTPPASTAAPAASTATE